MKQTLNIVVQGCLLEKYKFMELLMYFQSENCISCKNLSIIKDIQTVNFFILKCLRNFKNNFTRCMCDISQWTTVLQSLNYNELIFLRPRVKNIFHHVKLFCWLQTFHPCKLCDSELASLSFGLNSISIAGWSFVVNIQ